jgi:hypothetical protein
MSRLYPHSVVAYHGSPRKFDRFNAGKFKTGSQLGFGIHFTESPDFAAKYGRYIYKVRLSYTKMLDSSQVYAKGTPEFDLGIELYRGSRQAHMGVYFKEKGVTPICLDCASPKRAVDILRKYGFDCVRYNAVVTQRVSPSHFRRVGEAVSYVVLDPDQIEILEVADQGGGVKKEWNPSASNPDWSRESTKTILEWGWVSPSGYVLVGKRKDQTHNDLARSAGLGYSWRDAVNNGAVRYIIFTDGLLALTLCPTPDVVKHGIKLVRRQEVSQVSIEWADPESHKIEQTAILTPRQAELNMNAKITRKNPPSPRSLSVKAYKKLEEEMSISNHVYGFYDPSKNVVHLAKPWYSNHDRLALELGYSNAADAINHGMVRFYYGWSEVGITVSHNNLRGAYALLKSMPSNRSTYIDVFKGDGDIAYSVSGRNSEEAIQKLKSEIRRGDMKNPYAFSTHVSRFGFIRPNAAVVNAKKDEMSHQEVAERLGYPSENSALAHGLVRFLVYKDGQSDLEIDSPLEKVAPAIKGFVKKSPDVTGIVTVDAPRATPYWSIYADSPKEFLRKIDAKLAGREVNPPRSRNDAHWSSAARGLPWGLFSKDKIVSGLDYPDVTDHDSLASKLGLVNEESALLDGWVRYIFSKDGGDVRLGITILNTYPDEMAEVALKQVPKLEMEPDVVDLDITEVGGESITATYAGWPRARSVLRKIAAGTDLEDIQAPKRGNNPSWAVESVSGSGSGSGRKWPFRTKQVGKDLYEVEFFDHYKVMVGTESRFGSLVWTWVSASGDSHGEVRDNLNSVLVDLSLLADRHTGRKGGSMKFVIYSPNGRVLGTVRGEDRREARANLRGHLHSLQIKSPHDVYLYPYLNSPEEVRVVADQGVAI